MSRKWLLLMGAVVALAVTLACGDGGGDSGSSEPKKEAAGKIGQPVRDGKFEFTVQKVQCGAAKVGSDMLGDKAQGQFCLVTVKVKNIGKEPQQFSDSSQKGYGADGVEFAPDSEAGLYANGEQNVLLNEINPGNEVTGVIVFDIPKQAKLSQLELHDSPFSGGVVVTLS